MMLSHLDRTYVAQGAITQRRYVKFGTVDGTVTQAASAADALIGVCIQPGGALDGERVDIRRLGMGEVEYGGNVTRGDRLTSDAQGRAVTAAYHTHTENTAAAYTQNATTGQASAVFVGGIAEVSGVAGDQVEALIGRM